MKPMYLPDVERTEGKTGAYADLIRMVQKTGQPYSQIWHLFAYKPDVTRHLEQFTQGVLFFCAVHDRRSWILVRVSACGTLRRGLCG